MTTEHDRKPESRASLENPATPLSDPDAWLIDLFGGPTMTGVNVSEDSALSFSAVWACIRIISETLAMLPLHLYRRVPDGRRYRRELVSDHPGYRLVQIAPNDEMTPMVFRETVQAHLLGYGNGYALIRRRNDMTPIALDPLLPDRTRPARVPSGRLAYKTRQDDGTEKVLRADQVLHIPGLSFDGLVGMSPLRKHRESIGLGLAAQEFAARLFGDGTNLSGVLEHPNTLREGQAEKLAEQWRKFRAGLKNAHGVAVLEGGMKYNPIGIPPEDAQMLETRKFQITDIARIYRVPPHMLADLERATFSNIEHLSIEFVKYTMMPWLVRWEQELNRKLLREDEKDTHYFKFNVNGLLRGDVKSRYEAYHIAWGDGWLSQNDIREFEDMDPIEDGDDYYVPLNMKPVGEEPEPEEEPADTEDPDETEQEGEGDDEAAGLERGAYRVIRSREVKFLRRLAKSRIPTAKRDVELQAFLDAHAEAMYRLGSTHDQMQALTRHFSDAVAALDDQQLRDLADAWRDTMTDQAYDEVIHGH